MLKLQEEGLATAAGANGHYWITGNFQGLIPWIPSDVSGIHVPVLHRIAWGQLLENSCNEAICYEHEYGQGKPGLNDHD
jgi:hypothetical protein